MKIQVLGSGCPSCHRLFELTRQAVEEMKLQAEVEYINDIEKILEMGVMSVPVLSIDGRAVVSGPVPGLERIKEILGANVAHQAADPSAPGCCEGDKDCCRDQSGCDTNCCPQSDDKPVCSCGGQC